VKSALPLAVWSFARRLRREWTRRTYRQRVVRHSYGGHPMSILLADPMAEAWYDMDWPVPPVIEMVRSHQLREGALVFDLGAHQGVMALILARCVGASGRVIALEAMEFNAAIAEKNRSLNDVSQLTILHAAAGEHNGRLSFNDSLNSAVDDSPGASRRRSVEALTVDELSRRYGEPDVIFMDIEGYECRALRGAERTLQRRPDLIIEVHTGHGLESFGGSVEEVVGFFPPEAYDLYMSPEWATPEGGCRPFDPDDPLVRSPLEPFYLVALGRRAS
jgi:FkbM family methyltransferase